MPHHDAIQKGIDMKIHDGRLLKIKYRKVEIKLLADSYAIMPLTLNGFNPKKKVKQYG